MRVFKGKERWATVAAVLLSVLIMGGCATSIKYSFDTKTRFAEQKSYTWTTSSSLNQTAHLLEMNVQVLADQLLAQKGFKKVPEKADLVISMSYEYDYGNQNRYQLRMLNLNIYKAENMELVWRGTALGTINTDAASSDLKQAVQGILSNFPPKVQ
jgi:outer membrane murein-binding lipoprotein Lpp